MHTWIEIDREALVHNFMLYAELLGEDRLAPVVKSNAYGHGLAEVYQALASLPLSWLCVNYLQEASLLRQLKYQGRILIVGPVLKVDLEEAHKLRADVIIGNQETLEAWRLMAPRPSMHLKVDTGLSRRGFQPEQLPSLAEELKPYREQFVGLATHFANVEDVSETSFAMLQLQRLLAAQALFKQEGFQLLTHAASSASSLLLEPARLDLCRVGISLYGLWPSRLTKLSYRGFLGRDTFDLRPVLSWRTRLMEVKVIENGDFVGYGCTFKATRNMKVGVISVGYYEGYPWIAGGRGAYVLIRGKRCPLLGRVCMNMAIVDLENARGVKPGDQVTLLGKEGQETISAEQLASWAETINYEVVTRLPPNIPRSLKP